MMTLENKKEQVVTASDVSGDRRRFTRIHFDAQTEICHAGQQQSVQLMDISFNGLLVQSNVSLAIQQGAEVEARIHIGDNILHIPAVLTHHRDDLYGFHIERLDIDCATHLHRLVELNLGDETLLKRELEHLMPNP
ncbi:PilZ domain-containing protein [Pontibacterium granulatum]|uniref:PilZ domain-containing protein n=1 Tax=Pontibacterium granulatum TaxID=2036029 RepID=UPI00249BBFD0|nr:PilZ domain-containing protein [Pontibacterium granulatum]